MPLPLSLAITAVSVARAFHTAPSFRRPSILRRVYYARLLVYGGTALAIITPFHTQPSPVAEDPLQLHHELGV